MDKVLVSYLKIVTALKIYIYIEIRLLFLLLVQQLICYVSSLGLLWV